MLESRTVPGFPGGYFPPSNSNCNDNGNGNGLGNSIIVIVAAIVSLFCLRGSYLRAVFGGLERGGLAG